jgi:anti-sigma-K factor RskA
VTADPRDRLLDLLTAEATQRLSPAEARELADLLRHHPYEDPDALALAAAAADLAMMGDAESLPPTLASRLDRHAAAFAAPPPHPPPAGVRGASALAWLGWVVAACLAGVLVWTNWPKPVAPPPTPAQLFDQMASRPSVRAFRGEKEGVAGEVRWDEAKQEGYVQVRGLPALDPTKNQYQLWIVDPDQELPVDGGVFDVKSDGTAVVPVKAALRVKNARAFAITKEKSGGVVRSGGPHLLVLAPPKA